MCYWCCFRQKYGRTVPARRDSRASRSSRRDSRRWSLFTIFMKDVLVQVWFNVLILLYLFIKILVGLFTRIELCWARELLGRPTGDWRGVFQHTSDHSETRRVTTGCWNKESLRQCHTNARNESSIESTGFWIKFGLH